jgi:protein-S-isoprenylcysteine O-methyltransferase Ste14
MRVPSLGSKGEGWVAIQFVLMAAVVAAAVLPPEWPDEIERELAVAGLALAVAGGVLLLMAGFALGHAMTPFSRPRAESVVDRGPYRFLRHPMYAGGILFFLGVALLGSVPSLLFVGALAVTWALKAVDEERRLEERFPEYEQYRERVRDRLAPGLY